MNWIKSGCVVIDAQEQILTKMGRLSFLRYISIVGAAFSFIGSGFMFYLGSESTIKTVLAYFKKSPTTEKYVHLTEAESSLVSIIEADLFLFAFVILIFSFGIIRIFVLMGDGSDKTHCCDADR